MAPELRRTLGFRDLVLFYLATTLSLRWIATAAAAGPSALVIWVFAAIGLFVPLVFTVLELSSRHPDEGGMYVWAKRAFGPFAGFMTGWTYWCSNLPYFPGLLYFAAANVLFAGGPSVQALSTNSMYFLVVSLAGLAVAVGLNVVGLNIGKWMTNISALAGWVPVALLIVFGFYSWMTYGSATPITAQSLLPSTGLKDVIFWSTIAFAFGGVENASTMGEEIVDARRTVPKAVLTAAVLITTIYIVATLCLLLALPKEQVSGLQGLMQAIQAVAGKAGVPWLVPILAVLVSLNAFGGVAGWFAATARLPFVAGIDRFLPRAFADLHPRWHTPYVALLVQAVIATVFVFLGQAGTSVRGAYEVLVSMSIIGNFIPFLFMFAAMIKLQGEPAGPGVLRVPGGAGVALLVQAAIAAVFVFLGQAGTSVRGAYEVLVSMAIIGNFIPFLFMFAAMIKLQGEPAAPGVLRVPGGAGVARLLGAMGFIVSAAAIVLACVPADEEPFKGLAVAKVVGASVALLAIGAMIYGIGKRRT